MTWYVPAAWSRTRTSSGNPVRSPMSTAVTMAAETGSCVPTHLPDTRRTRRLHAGGRLLDRAAALAHFHEQAALHRREQRVPSSARSRSKSGTPSFRYRAGLRNVTGISSVLPATHSAPPRPPAAPLTLTTSPPSTACHAAVEPDGQSRAATSSRPQRVRRLRPGGCGWRRGREIRAGQACQWRSPAGGGRAASD